MLNKGPKSLFVLWMIYAVLMGFALGGSFVSVLLSPQSAVQNTCAVGAQSAANCETPEQRHEAAEAALKDYTKWLMIFTGVLAFATIGLWIATYGLNVSGERQIEIANRALMATHRPKVGIRRLDLVMPLENNKPVQAKFILVNRGASKAYVEKANGILYFRSPDSGPGFRYAFDDYQGEIEGCPDSLDDGEFKEVKIRSVDLKETADRRHNGKWFIYAAGRIIYKDETGTRRTTAFLRVFKSGIEWTFLPVNDPEYEYED